MRGTARSPRFDRGALAVAIVAVVGVALYRVITLGNEPVAPNDAVYIGVGRALWQLQEPLNVDGSVFTIRSWAFPLMTGGASRLFEGGLFGGDPFTGPRLLGFFFGSSALALAVTVAYRLARGGAAITTALVLLMTPVLWTVVPSTLVDGALMFFAVVVLLTLDTPTPRRMLVGGVLVGVTVLVKETSVGFVLLPLAYLDTMPRPEWARLMRRYLLGFAVVVGWWFVVVLVLRGEIFPLEGFQQAAGRDVPRSWSLDVTGWLLVAAWVVGWIVVAVGRRAEPRARLLLIAGAAFVPAAAIAWVKELAMRQFAPIAMLSCIALGVALVDVWRATFRAERRPKLRPLGAAAAIVLLVVALVPVALAQDRTPVSASSGSIDQRVTEYLADRPGEPTVAATFRYRGQVWARLAGRASLGLIRFDDPVPPPELEPAVWVDWRRGHYHVLTREELTGALRDADYLLLTGPHRLGPIQLATWLEHNGENVGITPVARFGPVDGTSWAYVYRLDDPQVDEIPTIVSTTAAERMVAEDAFTPTGRVVIAGTTGGFIRLGREIPIDDYEQLPAPLR